MANRRTNRRISIRFIGRAPGDPLRLLQIIDDVFRPQEIEITVEKQDADSGSDAIANEVLETHAREAASDALDERNQAEVARLEVKSDSRRSRKRVVDDKTPVGTGTSRRMALLRWTIQKVSSGWTFVAKVVPVLKQLKDFL